MKNYELSALEKLSIRISLLDDIRDFLETAKAEEKETLDNLIFEYGEEDAEKHLTVKCSRYRISEYNDFIRKIDEIAENAL